MKLLIQIAIVAATVACCTPASSAAGESAPLPLTPASPGVEPGLRALVHEASDDPAPLTLLLTQVPAVRAPEFAGVHYQPKGSSSYHRSPQSSGVSQLHIGFFEPGYFQSDGAQASRLDVGLRGGPMLSKNLQVGLAVDWMYRSENISSVSTATVGPGGTPIAADLQIARASVHMFPILGFMQISAPASMSIVPYIGGGTGYEVLVLSGDDFLTGLHYEGTFGGWGWQAWGGVGIPLGGPMRLNAEAFVNGGTLGRDVVVDPSGFVVRETVKADGAGMRFGIAWGF